MAVARPRPAALAAGLALLAGLLATPPAVADSPAGQISTLGGSPGVGDARTLHLYAEGIAVRDGQLYVPDQGVLRQIDLATGQASVMAGDGSSPAYGIVSDKVAGALRGAAVDAAGNVVVAERNVPGRVLRVDRDGPVTVLAGDGITRTGQDADEDWGDGGLGTDVPMSYAYAVALAPDGSVYVAQANYHRVRRIEPSGRVSTVAGTGVPGLSGDGGPATAAQLTWPSGVAVDAAGALYIADSSNQRIRKVDPSGMITTAVGGGSTTPDVPDGRRSSSCEGQRAGMVGGFAGDGGPGVAAQLRCPSGVAVDADGSLYIADTGNHRLRRVGPDGRISTLAGNGDVGYGPDSGPATGTPLYIPAGVAVEGGTAYVTDANVRVRRITPDGRMETVAGRPDPFTEPVEGVPATTTEVLAGATAPAPDGGTYVSSGRHIRHIDRGGVIRTVAGRTQVLGPDQPPADGTPAREALLGVTDLAVGDDGSLLMADRSGILRLEQSTGRVRRVAFGGTQPPPDDGPAADVALSPSALALAPDGSTYVAQDDLVWRLDVDGSLHRVLGVRGGDVLTAEEGRPGRETPIMDVSDLAVTEEGDLLVAARKTVWRVDGDGIATVAAGQVFRGRGANEYDDDVAELADLETSSVVADSGGVLYLTDRGRIRRVTPDGAIRTVAGLKLAGFAGDGGPAVDARLAMPRGLSLSPVGDLVVAEPWNARVRRIRHIADAPSVAESGDRPTVTVTVEPDGVPLSEEPIDPRDPERPPAHPGVVKLTARASAPDGVRELRIDSQATLGGNSSRAAARESLDMYVSQAGTYQVTVTATDGEGNQTQERVHFSVADSAEASAPACAGAPEDGFSDVAEGDVHESSIDCATWWKVTRGAAGGGYAPNGEVTRAQMASFLVRVLEAGGKRVPSSRDYYVDDEQSPHEASINDLADAGILTGTGPATYSPDRPVTRGQVATMVARTFERVAGAGAPAQASFFVDDSFDVHRDTIDRAAEAALLTGTASGRYAPGRVVSRAQLASMLSRVLARLADRGLVTRPG